ncbi:unnamed protein product, partial [Discosporangium mesarthrocarpum]
MDGSLTPNRRGQGPRGGRRNSHGNTAMSPDPVTPPLRRSTNIFRGREGHGRAVAGAFGRGHGKRRRWREKEGGLEVIKSPTFMLGSKGLLRPPVAVEPRDASPYLGRTSLIFTSPRPLRWTSSTGACLGSGAGVGPAAGAGARAPGNSGAGAPCGPGIGIGVVGGERTPPFTPPPLPTGSPLSAMIVQSSLSSDL